MYYRNAQSALVVYDLTKSSSLAKAKHWVAELQRQASPGIVIALVGNKLDLTSQSTGLEGSMGGLSLSAAANSGGDGDDEEEEDARQVTTAEAKAYADEEGLLFYETSAKTGHNVSEVFTAIANAIPESTLKTRGGPGSGRTGAGGGSAGETFGGAGGVNLSAAGETNKETCAC
ncbi:hypothetical protein AA313_de0201495 [Arthrobotrys entomopaga]|nr:hypothetical protein AA313_de0201495 [Arthrobotrys entomopaga]